MSCYGCYSSKKSSKWIRPRDMRVLVSGCDSGFGRALMNLLQEKNATVFAGCLTHAAVSEIKALQYPNVFPLPLDVTSDEQVQNAVVYVQEHFRGRGLDVLVNNAGVAGSFLVDISTVKDFRDCMEVNFLGMVRMTKAFLPLIKASQGRFVNMTSINGIAPARDITAYTASKHAATGFTEAFAQEMKHWNVKVVEVCPGWMKTPILNVNERIDRTWASMDPHTRAQYGEDFPLQLKKLAAAGDRVAENPSKVLKAYKKAIFCRRPRRRYVVGSLANQMVLGDWALTRGVFWMTSKMYFPEVKPAATEVLPKPERVETKSAKKRHRCGRASTVDSRVMWDRDSADVPQAPCSCSWRRQLNEAKSGRTKSVETIPAIWSEEVFERKPDSYPSTNPSVPPTEEEYPSYPLLVDVAPVTAPCLPPV